MQEHTEDTEGFEQRLAAIESKYPGPKTAGFYEAIERANLLIERPDQLLQPEHDARVKLDRTIGKWVADGSYEDALKVLAELLIGEFDFAALTHPDDPPNPKKPPVTRPLTEEEERLYPLAQTIKHVTGKLIKMAPPIIGDYYGDHIPDELAEKKGGWTWSDLAFLSKVEQNKRQRDQDGGDKGDGNSVRFRSIQIIGPSLPLILALINVLA